MKYMNFGKKIFCIFLAVMMLFFGVNNSYFSPQKMDKVEASAVVATAAISMDLVIKLITAVGITGLSIALIDNLKDWNWQAILEDLHSWCREHIDILEQYVTEGSSALKEWALADEWTVIEGGGGSAPEPSPSLDPDDKPYHEKVWGANDVWTIGNMIAGAGVLSAEVYNKYVPQDESVIEVAKAYVHDKVANFETATPAAGTDPITESLKATYVLNDKPYYSGEDPSIHNSDGTKTIAFNAFYTFSGGVTIKCSGIPVTVSSEFKPYAFISGGSTSFYYGKLQGDRVYAYTLEGYYQRYKPNGDMDGSSRKGSCSFSGSVSCNFPLFASLEAVKVYLSTGDDSGCINKQVVNRKYNYIDTNGEYGWASTADLSPADLLAANPALANNLSGKDVSIASLIAAINALKAKLEEQNPNTPGVESPVTYPDVPTYTKIVPSVIDDPETFPVSPPVTEPDPGTDPKPDPGTETDPESGKDYTGLLGIIINLLKSILQAIKDFMSWFIIDFDAIKAHLLLALQNVPAFSGFDGFLAILDRIRGSISDSYEYPKITIKTPDILKQFLKTDEILLLDFEDYATYFLWVRTAMGFAILFGFFMWVVRDIKVELTLN